jgi:NAD(P)-dependent dehydrogenase (short-subunit alcohol dehydrogenase family)
VTVELPVVVFGTATPFGRRVAQALDHVGIAATAVDVDLDDPAAVAGAVTGEIGSVVYAHVDPRCLEPQAFVGVDPAQWDAACERQLRMLLHVVQASYAPLARSRGAMVCVCPTVALQGAANLAMFAAVAEGQRILAKSAARQWGNDGIRVNIISPSIHDLLDDPLDARYVDARRGRTPIDAYDTDAALREVLPFLLTTRAVTALTVPLDGGQVTAL